MTPILDLRDITRSFTSAPPVLNGVSLQMATGEVVGLLGRNGAGKTTLIQIAMGMLFPHSGSVRVFGMSPVEQPVDVKRRIGYVAEEQVFPPLSSVAEILTFHRHVFPTWDVALEKSLLDRFALGGTRRRISHLSKGQARQVALICAIAHRPELLILDEPAGGLDPAARREFLETSIQLLNADGSAILFSSHHLNDVERLGGRVVLLDKGKIALDRELDSLREGHCIAIVSRHHAPDIGEIQKIPGAKRVRVQNGEYHIVFQGTPEVARGQIRQSLGVDEVTCVQVPLEELFVEFVGADRFSGVQ